MNRTIMTKLGQETCKRVANVLEKYGVTTIIAGQNAIPNLLLRTYFRFFGIEVKRCKGISFKQSVNSISITKNQWIYLKDWCSKNNAIPIVIVEIFVSGGENIYFVLNHKVIEKKFEDGKGRIYFGFSMWQVIREGKKLDDYFVEVLNIRC